MNIQSSQKIIAIILARGGSKGIPGKNIIDFSGKPLLVWTIQQALAADAVERVYVSSDSEAILNVAFRYGAHIIQRPDEISGDTATSESALLHALDVIAAEEGKEPEALLFLQATSPLRGPGDIDGAVAAFFADEADSLFSCAILDDFCAWQEDDGVLKGRTFDPFNRGRRQDRKPLYLENGSIYVFKTVLLRQTGNRLGGRISRFSMDYWKSFEIDSQETLELCDYYFRKKLLHFWDVGRMTDFLPSLLVYDFDGVMTDNRVLVMQDGTEAVLANRADGWGVGRLRGAGYQQLIFSTELNPVVSARGAKLGIEVVQGSGDKGRDLAEFCRARKISLSQVLYVGNDVNDLEAMRMVGFSVAPADSHPSILAIARHVTRARGGEGVIKELSELLLASKVAECS